MSNGSSDMRLGMVLRSSTVPGKLANPSVVARGTAQIHLTPKTVRRAFGSHPRYRMDPFSSDVGACPGTELAGCTVYRVTVTIY